MNLFTRLTSFFRGGAQGDQPAPEGKSDLQTNMEKALAMKQAAGPQAHIPGHRTAHEGMRPEDVNKVEVEREALFTPTLKRSKVARSGDAS